MKNVLFEAFYTLQGIGNLIFGLFFVKGGPGGGGLAMEIVIRSFLVFSSSLSLSAVLMFVYRRESWARVLGNVSSVLFGAFYTWIAVGITESIAFGTQQIGQWYYSAAFGLMLCIFIVILNIISILSLRKGTIVNDRD